MHVPALKYLNHEAGVIYRSSADDLSYNSRREAIAREALRVSLTVGGKELAPEVANESMAASSPSQTIAKLVRYMWKALPAELAYTVRDMLLGWVPIQYPTRVKNSA